MARCMSNSIYLPYLFFNFFNLFKAFTKYHIHSKFIASFHFSSSMILRTLKSIVFVSNPIGIRSRLTIKHLVKVYHASQSHIRNYFFVVDSNTIFPKRLFYFTIFMLVSSWKNIQDIGIWIEFDHIQCTIILQTFIQSFFSKKTIVP